jgi:myo-inositol 2-dehydrogenase / D-chiro-inositol 1-dehydrogenase
VATTALNVGLIGVGRIGRLHAGHLAHRIASANLLAVADPLVELAESCAREHGIPMVCSDYRDLLASANVEAIVICSSTDTHAQIIADAAQAGKHVFCEKPIALTLPSIDLALQAVADAGVKLQVGFNRRFDTTFRRVHESVTRGEIGRAWLLHITSRDPSPPPLDYVRVSGGLFLDMTIHDFDLARFLIGSEVEEVYAQAAVMVDQQIGEAGDVDTAVVTLKFQNGVLGTISNSRQAVYGYDQRVEILGSAGMVSTANHFPNAAELSTANRIQRDLPHHFFLDRYADSYLAEMQAFVSAVLEDQPVSVSGQDGRVPVVLGLAAQMSLLENRPVRIEPEIPLDGEHG